jgi:anti-sigma B factor antagonist
MYEPHGPNGDGGPGTDGGAGSLEPAFTCRVSATGERARVELAGELDLASAPEFERELERLLEEPVRDLTLDLTALSFLDSSGLGALCRAQEVAERRGIDLRLVSVPEHARRVLEITGLTGLFRLE